MTSERPYSAGEIFGRVSEEIRPHWPGLVILLGLSALAAPVALLAPLPLKIVLDSVLGSHPIPSFLQPLVPDWLAGSQSATLWFAVALVVVIAFVALLLQLGTWLLREYLGERITLEFRSKLFQHVSQLSLAQHDTRGSSDLTYRIQYDAPAIRWLVMDGALPFLTALLTLVAMLYVIARLDATLGLVALIIVPVIFLFTRLYSSRLRTSWRRVKKTETSALSVVQEVVGAIRVVKAFGQEDREQKRLFEVARQGIRERIRVILAESEYSFLIGIAVAIGTATVLFVGAQAVGAGRLTSGDLVLVMAYIAQLYVPVQTMGKQIAAQQGSLASAERALSILDESPAVTEAADAKPLLRAKGDISFKGVSFGYDGSRSALHDITFSVPAGSTVGIIGKTGSGKTTLFNLLTRFYDPTEGAVYLDDKDIRSYRIPDFRNQYSIVLQEPVLFPTSIAENIAYGAPKADRASIVEAAKQANAHDFIEKLPEGYETLVGDRGTRLSGGERQRVSLARAFIKDSPLLVLDEPTSSVDQNTEDEIIEAILRLISDRTTFIIAHRLRTLRYCNMLLLLKDGHVEMVTDNAHDVLQHLIVGEQGQVVMKDERNLASVKAGYGRFA